MTGRWLMMLKKGLACRLTQGQDIDDPRIAQLRRQVIQKKSFLRQVYREWYAAIAATLPEGESRCWS